MTLPSHLSYSQISTYLACPLKYKFKYVDEIPPAFTAASLVFGSAIHETVAAFYNDQLIGQYLRPDQMLDVYRDVWQQAENIRFFNGDNESSLQSKAEQILRVFHESFVPSTSIIGVEEFFEISLGDLPPFQGYIDLIEQSLDGKVTIVDLKTSSRKLTDGGVHQNLQLTAYAVGSEVLGFDPDALDLRLDVLLKTKSPELVRQGTTRTADERRRFVKMVRHGWKGIQREVWFPNADWQCVQCAYAVPCSKWL